MTLEAFIHDADKRGELEMLLASLLAHLYRARTGESESEMWLNQKFEERWSEFGQLLKREALLTPNPFLLEK